MQNFTSPANFLTPNLLPAESRPFEVEPPCFFEAQRSNCSSGAKPSRIPATHSRIRPLFDQHECLQARRPVWA
eukprot:4163479-Pyramimonas_sp.AAC.1